MFRTISKEEEDALRVRFAGSQAERAAGAAAASTSATADGPASDIGNALALRHCGS